MFSMELFSLNSRVHFFSNLENSLALLPVELVYAWGGNVILLCYVVKLIILLLIDPVMIFEHTCAYARWALMHRFLSVCPSVRLSVCLSVCLSVT